MPSKRVLEKIRGLSQQAVKASVNLAAAEWLALAADVRIRRSRNSHEGFPSALQKMLLGKIQKQGRPLWNDISWEKLHYSVGFKSYKTLHLLPYLWGKDGANERVARYALTHGVDNTSARVELGEFVTEEILAIYDALRDARRPLSAEELLRYLHQKLASPIKP